MAKKTKLVPDHLHWTPKDLFADIRNDLVAAFGEFVKIITFLLISLGGIQASATSNAASAAAAAAQNNPTSSAGVTGSAVINTVASSEQLVFISVSMGLSLLFSAWIFYQATGAAFNLLEYVSFALLLVGVISPTRFLLYMFSQFVGSIMVCAFLEALLPSKLEVTPSLGAGTNSAQGLFIKCFATCGLILSVLFLVATVYTRAAMNSTRAFGPSVITGFGTDHWIYFNYQSSNRLGPTLGSILAVAIYTLMKRFKYWKLNEGQDTDESWKLPALFVEENVEQLTGRKPSIISRVSPSFGQVMAEAKNEKNGPNQNKTNMVSTSVTRGNQSFSNTNRFQCPDMV
ncbi:aquaporin-like protein [Phakopsora pachyrhizi]|uniref:Aquaporin-like protein n=1 Tax=Phakopsora pachyrhizi TaxID=170000 RepID=A0AAV0B8H8_PHAPC|nr:aquaporin-like protein [Phakopsora pachyrhizi]